MLVFFFFFLSRLTPGREEQGPCIMSEGSVGLVSILQAHDQASEAAAHAVVLFQREAEIMRRQHDAKMDQRTAFFFEQVNHAKMRHKDSTHLKLQTAAKEALHDNWQQHNEMYQARILTATLMFGCSYSSLADGNQMIPQGTPESFLIAYSIIVSVGVALMLACLLCLIALYRRLSRFDTANRFVRCARCGKAHVHFDMFFRCACWKLDTSALVLFYSGSFVTFVGAVVLQLTKFNLIYLEWTIQGSTAMLVGFAMPGIAVGTLGHLLWPSDTRSPDFLLSPVTPLTSASMNSPF